MLDWDDLRFFLAVARHGSLSAASKDLRVAQSTVGRRLTSLEAALGVRLLNRTPDGYMKTLAGAEVQAGVERLEAEILGIERSVSGRDTSLAGVVRVTCAETVANYILAPGLAALRKQHPDIVIDLIADQRDLSLAMREAEISIRLVQAEHHDLLARKIGRFTFALYACPAYLSEHGEPSYDTGCSGHQLIVQTGDLQDPERAAWLASLAPRARIGIQTSSHEAAVIAALHGAGLACLARFRADRETGLRRLAAPSLPPDASVWLIVHHDNRHNPRIRAALTHIADCFRALSTELIPVASVNVDGEPRTRWLRPGTLTRFC